MGQYYLISQSDVEQLQSMIHDNARYVLDTGLHITATVPDDFLPDNAERKFERGDRVETIRAVKIDTDSAVDVILYSGVKGLIRAINDSTQPPTLYVLFDCYPVIQAWVGPDDIEAAEDEAQNT